jgi:lysophospholipase L1-like esterase
MQMGVSATFEKAYAGMLLGLLSACDEPAQPAPFDDKARQVQMMIAPDAALIPALFRDTPLAIEYYGASSVWGASSGNAARQSAITEPQAFQAAIAEKFPHAKVSNHGINGTTARDWLYGGDAVGPSWDARMKASRADIVIVQLGVNDSNSYPVETYVHALEGLVRRTHAAGKLIILETPGPVDNPGLAPYAQAMIELAGKLRVPLIDQYSYWTAWMAANRVRIRTLVPDGTHPSDAWYIEKGKYAARVFNALQAPLRQHHRPRQQRRASS